MTEESKKNSQPPEADRGGTPNGPLSINDWHALVIEESPSIRIFVRVKLPLSARDATEDLVNSVIERVLELIGRKRASNVRPEGARGFFLRVAHFVVLEYKRRLIFDERRGVPFTTTMYSDLALQISSVCAHLAKHEQLDAFADFVLSLPPKDQKMLTWRALEGLSFEVVAQRLGIETEAARQRWSRLLARLRNYGIPPSLQLEQTE